MRVVLGDMARFKGGSAFPRNRQGNTIGDVPFLKVSDLSRGTGAWKIDGAANWLTTSQISELKPVIVPAMSTVFAKIGEGLKAERCRIVTRPTAIDNNMMAAIPNESTDPWFLYYLMKTIGLSSFVVGSALPYLKQSTLANVPVEIPERGESRAIAKVLGALDDKIASNVNAIEQAKRLSVALAAQASSTVPVAELAKQSRETVVPQRLVDTLVHHFSLPAFDARQVAEVVDPADIKSNKFRVSTPAVLVSKLNPRFPRVWDVPVVPDVPALASTEFVVLEPNSVTTTVLWALLSQPNVARALQSMVAGTSGSHQRVKPEAILATEIGDPSTLPPGVPEQITAVGERAEAARAENLALQAARDALLPGLMSGKLRVRDAERVAEEVA